MEPRFEPLDFKLSTITTNLQTELDINQPDPIEPAPPRNSPMLHTINLHTAASALQYISDSMNVNAASPPPVYALTHPLELAHNPVPFIGGMLPSQDPPLQITTMTVTITLIHVQQQVHVEGSSGGGSEESRGGDGRGGGGSGSGGSRGDGRGGPPGGQPTAMPAAAQAGGNNGCRLVGKEPMLFDGLQSKSKTFLQEFELYINFNSKNHTIEQPYYDIMLTLSYMKGPKINDWVQSMV